VDNGISKLKESEGCVTDEEKQILIDGLASLLDTLTPRPEEKPQTEHAHWPDPNPDDDTFGPTYGG